jgi:rhodanese-related sulfurtransferase/biotin operon repressor
MSSDSPKHALFIQFALVAKTLGHADRLEMIEQLGQGERSVEALAQRVGLSIANTSQHLQQLRRAGLVASRRDGKLVLNRMDRIVHNYFSDRDSMESVSREDLLERVRDGLVTVLDVRPTDEFAAGHLPGAINIPLNELEARIAELDPGLEIVAYCRSAYCVLSFEAVATLRIRGFKALRLEEGLPEWKAAGLPVWNA